MLPAKIKAIFLDFVVSMYKQKAIRSNFPSKAL
jgi:hypothetical protein